MASNAKREGERQRKLSTRVERAIFTADVAQGAWRVVLRTSRLTFGLPFSSVTVFKLSTGDAVPYCLYCPASSNEEENGKMEFFC